MALYSVFELVMSIWRLARSDSGLINETPRGLTTTVSPSYSAIEWTFKFEIYRVIISASKSYRSLTDNLLAAPSRLSLTDFWLSSVIFAFYIDNDIVSSVNLSIVKIRCKRCSFICSLKLGFNLIISSNLWRSIPRSSCSVRVSEIELLSRILQVSDKSVIWVCPL